jgi:hypothetical protein
MANEKDLVHPVALLRSPSAASQTVRDALSSPRRNFATVGAESFEAADRKFNTSHPMVSLDEDKVIKRGDAVVSQQSFRSQREYRRGPTRRRSERYSMRSCFFPDQ